MGNEIPPWPCHDSDGVWYCDAHGTFDCRQCSPVGEVGEGARKAAEDFMRSEGYVGLGYRNVTARLAALLQSQRAEAKREERVAVVGWLSADRQQEDYRGTPNVLRDVALRILRGDHRAKG